MAREDSPVDCVRLSEPLRRQLLSDLEEAARSGNHDEAANRRFNRHDFHGRHVTLTLIPSQGSEQRFVTISRNLSATGASVIHGGFVYDNTRVRLTLPTLTDEIEHIKGRVVRCRLVRGALHELGIEFDRAIDPRLFVAGCTPSPQELELTGEPIALTGRILALDDQEAELLLLRHHLSRTDAEVVAVSRSEDAFAALETRVVDAFVCDMTLSPGDLESGDVIREARERGYRGPIVILTARTSPSELLRYRELGAAAVLLKPYNPTKLLQTLSELCAGAWHGPIRSTLPEAEAPETAKLLREYVESVRSQAQAIEHALGEEDFATAVENCRGISETGLGFGFGPLSEAASRLSESLAATASAAESRQDLLALREAVQRLEAPKAA